MRSGQENGPEMIVVRVGLRGTRCKLPPSLRERATASATIPRGKWSAHASFLDLQPVPCVFRTVLKNTFKNQCNVHSQRNAVSQPAERRFVLPVLKRLLNQFGYATKSTSR